MNSLIVCMVIYLFLNITSGYCGVISSNNEPALLVISFDAFRPDFLNRNITPNLNKFRKDGVSADFMMNVFPTKTLTNHFTIATGLYAESHGVVSNEFYDRELNKTFKYSYEMFHYRNTTEPIWSNMGVLLGFGLSIRYNLTYDFFQTKITNEKKNWKTFRWPGSDYEYNGINCTFTGIFNKSEIVDRIDTALSWFLHPKTPANLVMLYIEQPDEYEHAYGHDSPMITNLVSKLDNITGLIQDKLNKLGLDKRVNVVHLSDHGMNDVTPPNFIDLTKFVAENSCKMFGSSPVIQIVPNNAADENEIFANLTKAAKQNGHFKVYNEQNIPARWHVNNPNRIGPIFVVADVEYGFQDLIEAAKYYERAYNISITNETKYEVHGYDNEDSSMHAMFMAKGPIFAKGNKVSSVNIIDLYNVFCRILNIERSPNDGSNDLDDWKQLFVEEF